MDIVHDRCAGIDIGKVEVVVCVRTPADHGGRRQQIATFGTFTGQLEELAAWLTAEGVTAVVMEATGQYWKPVWYLLEEQNFDELKLVNARHVKMLPGRKTDVADAQWLAELFEAGLLQGSFVPPPAIRELRDLTRYRKRLVQDRAREHARIEKILEDAGIKLDIVASDILGVSGTAMLHAIVDGERNPTVLAELAKGKLRNKRGELRQALHGRLRPHHVELLRLQLRHVEHLDAAITELDAQIDTVMAPFSHARDLLDTIPGVGKRAAECIIAEIGVDMTVFPTPQQLASWVGICPGNNITGGRRRSGRTRHGNQWLREILVECAWAAARTRDTYLAAQYWRLKGRIGANKAAIAVGHSILVAAWHILATNTPHHDLGGDYFTKRNPDRLRNRAIQQLHDLGYRVTLQPVAA